MAFRVTVTDLETGETEESVIHRGDYSLVTADPLYLDGIQSYANGTRVLTLKRAAPRTTEAPDAE